MDLRAHSGAPARRPRRPRPRRSRPRRPGRRSCRPSAASTQRCSSMSYAWPNRSTKPGVIWPPQRPSVALTLQVLVQTDDGAARLADHLGPHLVRHTRPDEDLVGDDPHRTRSRRSPASGRACRAGALRGRHALDHLRRWMISSPSRNRADVDLVHHRVADHELGIEMISRPPGCGGCSAPSAGCRGHRRRSASASATYSGSKRRMKPTWISCLPSAFSFCTIAYDEAMSVVSGFSQSTGMPRPGTR